MMCWICSVGNTILPSSSNVFATGCFSLTVMRSPTRSAMPSTGAESAVVHAGVDLEAVALARGVFPGMRAQIAQRQLALAAVEFGHLAEFGGVALAGAAGEIVEDAPARARMIALRPARLDQLQFVERLMGEKRPAAAARAGPSAKPASTTAAAREHQSTNRNRKRASHVQFFLDGRFDYISDGSIASQLGRRRANAGI